MREIKFRVWNKELKRIGYSDDPSFKSVGWWGIILCSPDSLGEFGEIIMQFTGLKDKNGKEIYEGDIVRCFDTSGEKVYDIEVDFYGFREQIWSEVDVNGKTKVEIIGNIYESPEFLKLN